MFQRFVLFNQLTLPLNLTFLTRGISQNQTDTARVSYSENISFFYSYLKHCLPLTSPSQGDGHDKKGPWGVTYTFHRR